MASTPLSFTKIALNGTIEEGRFRLSKICLERIRDLFLADGRVLSLKELSQWVKYGIRLPFDLCDSILRARSNSFVIRAIEEIGLEESASSNCELYFDEIPTFLLETGCEKIRFCEDEDYGTEAVVWKMKNTLIKIIDEYNIGILSFPEALKIISKLKEIAKVSRKYIFDMKYDDELELEIGEATLLKIIGDCTLEDLSFLEVLGILKKLKDVVKRTREAKAERVDSD